MRFKKIGVATLAIFAAGCGGVETPPKIITSTATVTSTVTSLPPYSEAEVTPFAQDLKAQANRLMEPYKERVMTLAHPGNPIAYSIADLICRSLKVGDTPTQIQTEQLMSYGSQGGEIVMKVSVKHFCIDQSEKISGGVN